MKLAQPLVSASTLVTLVNSVPVPQTDISLQISQMINNQLNTWAEYDGVNFIRTYIMARRYYENFGSLDGFILPQWDTQNQQDTVGDSINFDAGNAPDNFNAEFVTTYNQQLSSNAGGTSADDFNQYAGDIWNNNPAEPNTPDLNNPTQTNDAPDGSSSSAGSTDNNTSDNSTSGADDNNISGSTNPDGTTAYNPGSGQALLDSINDILNGSSDLRQ